MASEPTKWIIKLKDQKVIGPFSTDAVINFISKGSLTGEEFISKYPGGSWIPISKETDFYDKLLEAMENSTGKPTPFSAYENETVIVPIRKNLDAEKKEVELQLPTDPEKLEKPEEKGNTVIPYDFTKAIAQKNENSPTLLSQEGDTNAGVIELVSEKEVKSETEKKQKVVLGGILVLAAILIIYALFFDGTDVVSGGKIRLVFPMKNGSALSKEENKQLLQRSLGLIAADTLPTYVEAQNALVTLIESDPKEIKYKELLCLVYKELWPFSFQDSEDTQIISAFSIGVTSMDPTSRAAKSCELVKFLISGKFQEAKSRAEFLLSMEEEGAENTWIPFWYKIDMLLAEKNYIQADGYSSTMIKTWPYLVRGHVQYADVLNENNDPNKAVEQLLIALKMNPSHKAAKILLGLIYYRKLNQADKALTTLTSAYDLDQKVERLLESRGLFALAEIYLQRGQKDTALDYAEQAYRFNPSDSETKTMISQLGGSAVLEEGQSQHLEMVYMGDHYMSVGDCMSAQAEYKAAFEVDKTNAIAATRAAKCLWQLNQGPEAIEYLKKALQANSKYLQAYVLLADYYSQQYNFEQALRVVSRAKAIAPNSYEVARTFAVLENRRNNNQAAINYAKLAEKLFSADSETYVVMAKAYLELQAADPNNAKEGFKAAMRAIELDSSSSEGQIVYADALYYVQGTDSSLAYLESLVNKNPYVPEYRLALAERLKKEDRFKEAHSYYLQVMSISNKNKKAQVGIGESLQGLGQMDAALSAYLLAATLDPTDPEALMKAGLLYLETGRFGPAIQQFERVAKINKYYPRTKYFIGKAYYLQGNMDSALAAAEAEKKINPMMADAYILTAEIYTQMRSYTKCTEEYQRAIKLRSQKAEIYIKMARCYRLSGGLDVAESMLNIAESRESGAPELYKERGMLFQAQNMNREAVAAYNKYLALSPNALDRSEIERAIERLGGVVE